MIELAQILDCSFCCGPCAAEKFGIAAANQHIIVINHQDELGVEVFPVVGVLPARLIDGNEGIALRSAEVVGNRANLLAFVGDWLACLSRISDPESLFWPLPDDGIGKFQQHLFVDVRPEL